MRTHAASRTTGSAPRALHGIVAAALLAIVGGCAPSPGAASASPGDAGTDALAPEVLVVDFDVLPEPDSDHDAAAPEPSADGVDGGSVGTLDSTEQDDVADDDAADADSVGPPPTGLQPAPAGCTPPTDLPPDPLVMTASDRPSGLVAHYFNITASSDGQVYYVGGLPGLAIYEAGSDGLVPLGQYPAGFMPSDSVEALAEISPGWIATVRSKSSAPTFLLDLELAARLSILDVSNPASPALRATLALGDTSDVDISGTDLFITDPQGQLVVVDVSVPLVPVVVANLASFILPKSVAIRGELAYVADMVLGLVVVDISSPASPQVIEVIPVPGGAQRLMIDDGTLWLSLGGLGFQSYDLEQGDAPLLLGRGSTGHSVAGLHASGDRLWTAEYGQITAWDVSDPTLPRRLRSAQVGWSALDVLTLPDGHALVADWEEIERWELGPPPTAQLEVGRHGLHLSTETATATFQIASVGEVDLQLTGISADVAGYEVLLEDTTVPPGASVDVVVSWQGEGVAPAATLCIASNDPGQPVREVPVQPISPDDALGPPIGAPAPDFVLPDIFGDLHALSDHAGQPVLIVLFANWCPLCHFQLPDLEAGLWASYKSQGFQILAIGGEGESIGQVQDFQKKYKLTFPVLFDDGGAILEAYRFTQMGGAGTVPYPQDVLIDKDHVVIFRSSSYDPHAIEALLQPALEVQSW